MATGFYPDLADLFWRKDGEQIFEDVEHGELLPNHDGTFQMSVELKVEVTAEVEGKYECVFQLSGVKEDLVTKLERRSILSNASHEDNWSVALAATAAVVAVAAVLAAIIIVMVRRHRNMGVAMELVKQRPHRYPLSMPCRYHGRRNPCSLEGIVSLKQREIVAFVFCFVYIAEKLSIASTTVLIVLHAVALKRHLV
nr:HLA class I histocompatibility antigen, C alpha chain-like [Nerophis lumbriciformis]